MTRARKTLIALESTSYYHICVRAVRRSFLCGEDRYTGRNFDHRRQWLEDELLRLSEIFAIDISAYAILSNHYHVILHVDKARTLHWDAAEIVKRWHRLFKGSIQSQAFLRGEAVEGSDRILVCLYYCSQRVKPARPARQPWQARSCSRSLRCWRDSCTSMYSNPVTRQSLAPGRSYPIYSTALGGQILTYTFIQTCNLQIAI